MSDEARPMIDVSEEDRERFYDQMTGDDGEVWPAAEGALPALRKMVEAEDLLRRWRDGELIVDLDDDARLIFRYR